MSLLILSCRVTAWFILRLCIYRLTDIVFIIRVKVAMWGKVSDVIDCWKKRLWRKLSIRWVGILFPNPPKHRNSTHSLPWISSYFPQGTKKIHISLWQWTPEVIYCLSAMAHKCEWLDKNLFSLTSVDTNNKVQRCKGGWQDGWTVVQEETVKYSRDDVWTINMGTREWFVFRVQFSVWPCPQWLISYRRAISIWTSECPIED